MINSLIIIVLLPFLSAPLIAFFGARRRAAAAGLAFLITLTSLALLVITAWGTNLSQAHVVSFSWIPLIGLDFAFRLDGLSLLFGGIILIIGLLIIIYAQYYLSAKDSAARFFASLMLFMGAMLGIVFSENLIQLVVFWELTSLSSFLLISFWQHRKEARTGARMALTLTGFGGLALLGGVLLLGHVTGSYNLSVVLNSAAIVQSSPLYLPILILILLGVFTKSAQFPFHFWLPNAMAAPTPVSAYLHSATMVKAGIFLLARFFPVLAGTEAWIVLVGGAGLITFLLGAYTALFKHDLKGLLAYSTLSHLGLITLLMGFGTPLALVAGLFHLINHATFKASLFMVAGIVDHETGTRDMRRLGGLARHMPQTALLAMIAAAAMAGVPLLNGFLSKEMFFTEALDVSTGWVLPALVVFGALFSVAYSIRFIHDTFFGEPSPDLPTQIHEPPLMMRVPVLLLVVTCLAVGLAPAFFMGGMLNLSVGAALNAPAPYFSLALWHGFNAPLIMSLIAMLGGLLLYLARAPITRWHEQGLGRLDAKIPYNLVLRTLQMGSEAITHAFDQGRLQPMVFLTLVITIAAGLIGFWQFADAPLFGSDARATPFDGLTATGMILMLSLALVVTAIHAQRLIALLLLSVVGLGVSLLFVRYSAPDLALTQLSVEVVTLILLLLALRYLPQQSSAEPKSRQWRDAAIAAIAGVGAFVLTYAVMSRDFASIAGYFLENSLSQGGGHNVVNVILVDFRGYDTFGEITVLVLAALGIFALLQGIKLTPLAAATKISSRFAHPLLLQTVIPLLLPMTLLFGTYILLRGHNAPGGGFIAGLIMASAVMMGFIAQGQPKAGSALSGKAHAAMAYGLLLALGTGLVAIALGYPFLTSAFTHLHLPLIGDVEVASAMMFDLGVFFVVLGAGVLMLSQIVQIQAQEPPVDPFKEPS